MRTSELSTRQFLIIAVGSAIFLRLLLMPFFAHVDLFSEYRRVIYALDNHLFWSNTHRIVTFYIEMLFAGIAKLFIPHSVSIFHLEDLSKSTSSLQDYFLFLESKYIYRYLFFFKLPYFIFDLATAAVIWRFIDDVKTKRIALLLWLFNPITLFATYIFARFEVFGIFFLAITALQLKLHRVVLASVFFALALHCREIYFLLVPFLLIAMVNAKISVSRNSLILISCATIIALLYLLPGWGMTQLGEVGLFNNPQVNHQGETINKLFSLGYYWFYQKRLMMVVKSK